MGTPRELFSRLHRQIEILVEERAFHRREIARWHAFDKEPGGALAKFAVRFLGGGNERLELGTVVASLGQGGIECLARLAKRNGLRLDDANKLLGQLDRFFTNYEPRPSLLHGDLWCGNVAFGPGGEPVIFDPATYRGDREAEFGLADMFGGFGSAFWSAYEAEWPLDPGYSTRKLLYRLYHTLNHFNIFGGSYGSAAEGIVGRLLQAL